MASAVLDGRSRNHRPPKSQPRPELEPQVHTGTSSGVNADARMQNLLADHQFFRVQSELDELPPEQAQLYRGILANRKNDPQGNRSSCWSR